MTLNLLNRRETIVDSSLRKCGDAKRLVVSAAQPQSFRSHP